MGNGKIRRALPEVIISHWCKLISDLNTSSLHFYRRLEQVLIERQVPKLRTGKIGWHEGGLLSPKRQYLRLLRERIAFDVCAAPFGTGFFVSWRLGEMKLRLNFLGLAILILAPYIGCQVFLEYHRSFVYEHGNVILWVLGLLPVVLLILFSSMRVAVSRGLTDLDAIFLHTPVLAGFYEKFFRPVTYYRADLAMMYQEAVHQAILQVIDEMTDAQSLPRLTEADRKPVSRDFYKR